MREILKVTDALATVVSMAICKAIVATAAIVTTSAIETKVC